MEKKFEMSVNEIIKMKPRMIDEGTLYVDLSHLGEIYEEIGWCESSENLSEEMKKRVISKDFMVDKCCDSRSRTVEILFIDDKPVTFHQYMGTGRDENLKILNTELLEELHKDIMKNRDEKVETVSLDKPLEIMNYNMATTKIIDNQLVADWHKND